MTAFHPWGSTHVSSFHFKCPLWEFDVHHTKIISQTQTLTHNYFHLLCNFVFIGTLEVKLTHKSFLYNPNGGGIKKNKELTGK